MNANKYGFNVLKSGEKKERDKGEFPNPFENITISNLPSLGLTTKQLTNPSPTEGGDSLYDEIIDSIKKSEENDKLISDIKNFNLQFDDNPIKINYDKLYYYIAVKVDNVIKEIRISNFVVLPLYSIKSNDGYQKIYARLVNTDTSDEVIFDGEKLSNQRSFKTFVRNYGNYNWNGKPDHLNYLNDLLCAYRLDQIEEKTFFGWHRQDKIWLFPDRAYHNGDIYPMINNKVTINGHSYTFDKEILSEGKVLREHVDLPEEIELVEKVVDSFIKLYGNDSLIGIGWAIASIVVDEISTKKLAGQFPLLSPYGIYQSGKTGFARFISEFAGVDTALVTDPSKDVWRKSVHLFSCLPIMFDEIKEDKSSSNFFKYMRSYINKTFDRSTLKIGTLNKYSTNHYTVHATVALLGEVPPTDSAILSRFIYIDSSKFDKNKQLYRKLKDNLAIVNAIGQYFIRTSEEWKSVFIEYYKDYLKQFSELNLKDDRMEINYAIVLAGTKTFLETIDNLISKSNFNSDKKMSELLNYVVSKIKSNGDELRQSHPSIQFLEDIGTFVGEGNISDLYFRVYYNFEFEGKVYKKVLMLAPRGIWNSYNAKVSQTFYSTNIPLKKDLETYPFFLGTKSHRISSLKSAPTCWVIDLSHDSLPTEMQNFDRYNSDTKDNPN